MNVLTFHDLNSDAEFFCNRASYFLESLDSGWILGLPKKQLMHIIEPVFWYTWDAVLEKANKDIGAPVREEYGTSQRNIKAALLRHLYR